MALFLGREWLKALKAAVPEIDISVVVPAYNEALRIKRCLSEIEMATSSFSASYELIVTEDGSTDNTERVLTELSHNNPRLRFLHSPIRSGKGKAVKRALSSAKGDVIVFMDVDLATSLDYLEQIVKLAQAQRGMAIGSRHVKRSRVQRRVSRTIFSLAYNLFVKILFLDGVRDHQCGFKAMSREVAEALVDKSKSDGFFFDTEMILLCIKLGFPVMEIGVEWSENSEKGGSSVKLFLDAARLGLDLLKFRLNKNES